MKFDPTQHEGSGGGGGGRLEVAGEYLLTLTKLSREKTNSGKPYALVRARVITGSQKGRSYMERIYLNDEALWRLAQICKAVGHTSPFELGSDKELGDAILHKPFKARIRVKQEGDKKYAEMDFIFFKVTEVEQELMDAWVAERAAHKELGGEEDYDAGAPPHSDDDYAPAGPGRGASRRKDDDIPF